MTNEENFKTNFCKNPMTQIKQTALENIFGDSVIIQTMKIIDFFFQN